MPNGIPSRVAAARPTSSRARDLERGAPDDRRQRPEIDIARRLDGAIHHAGAADPDIDDTVRLGCAVESAGHERVVLDRVAEHDELGAADRTRRRGQLGRAPDHVPHLGDRIHVEAGAGRTDIDRRADALRAGERGRQGGDEVGVDRAHALFDRRREAADEVDLQVACGLVECFGDVDKLSTAAPSRDERDRRYGDPVVDDRQPELAREIGADTMQVLGDTRHLLEDVSAKRVGIVAHAIKQTDPDRDGADVELLRAHHLDGFEDLLAGEIELSHLR